MKAKKIRPTRKKNLDQPEEIEKPKQKESLSVFESFAWQIPHTLATTVDIGETGAVNYKSKGLYETIKKQFPSLNVEPIRRGTTVSDSVEDLLKESSIEEGHSLTIRNFLRCSADVIRVKDNMSFVAFLAQIEYPEPWPHISEVSKITYDGKNLEIIYGNIESESSETDSDSNDRHGVLEPGSLKRKSYSSYGGEPKKGDLPAPTSELSTEVPTFTGRTFRLPRNNT